MAEKNMNAKISVEFEETANRQQLSSGDNLPTLFGKIKKFFIDLKAVAFSGSYNDLSDTPTTATTDTDGLMSAADKTKLDNADNTYALKSLYGDTTINVGRKAGTDVGERSTAEGYNTTASGLYSHAEGEVTTASGEGSHAEGLATKATGRDSHAEGIGSIASGDNSHAGGNNSQASGISSFSHGIGTFAYADSEVAFGKYNIPRYDTLFSIGDGTADDARHNAFEITTDGGKLHDKDITTTDIISNPNLLINPDFKINQRGFKGIQYPSDSKHIYYTVDRWAVQPGQGMIVNSDNTVTIYGGCIQKIEKDVGDNVTASVGVVSGSASANYDPQTKTFSINTDGESAVISWAKLEYGNAATAFIPPDPATELMKCMRYYEKIVCSNNMYNVACQYFNNLRDCVFSIPMAPKRVPYPTSRIDYSVMTYVNSENVVAVSSAYANEYTVNSVSIIATLSSSTTVCTHGWVVDFMIEINAEIY